MGSQVGFGEAGEDSCALGVLFLVFPLEAFVPGMLFAVAMRLEARRSAGRFPRSRRKVVLIGELVWEEGERCTQATLIYRQLTYRETPGKRQ